MVKIITTFRAETALFKMLSNLIIVEKMNSHKSKHLPLDTKKHVLFTCNYNHRSVIDSGAN